MDWLAAVGLLALGAWLGSLVFPPRPRKGVPSPPGLVGALAALVPCVALPRIQWLGGARRSPSEPSASARHLAIIMDGNRRYGRARYKDALKGHWDGGQTLVDTVKWCMEEGLESLTVYAFSTENWKRETKEVDVLMTIFCKYAERCQREAMEKNIRICVFSTDRDRLPASVVHSIDQMETSTSANSGFRLNLCVSYGARSDLVQACQSISRSVEEKELQVEDINEDLLAARLTTAGLPEPDILLRTSGECRLSNFLLFELAYTELFFLDKFWPELEKQDLLDVLQEYERRQRRFGT